MWWHVLTFSMCSFGILPLGDTPSPGNSQNTIPYITPSPIGMGNITENVQQAPKGKVSSANVGNQCVFVLFHTFPFLSYAVVKGEKDLPTLRLCLCRSQILPCTGLTVEEHKYIDWISAEKKNENSWTEMKMENFPLQPMTRRSQQVTVPTTKPLIQSGIQSNVPGGVRRSTRLFTSSNTNATSSSVKVCLGVVKAVCSQGKKVPLRGMIPQPWHLKPQKICTHVSWATILVTLQFYCWDIYLRTSSTNNLRAFWSENRAASFWSKIEKLHKIWVENISWSLKLLFPMLWFAFRKTISHKVRTRNLPVQRRLQRNPKRGRVKLHKSWTRLTRQNWRQTRSLPPWRAHKHKYCPYKSSQPVSKNAKFCFCEIFQESLFSSKNPLVVRNLVKGDFSDEQQNCPENISWTAKDNSLWMEDLTHFRGADGTSGWYRQSVRSLDPIRMRQGLAIVRWSTSSALQHGLGLVSGTFVTGYHSVINLPVTRYSVKQHIQVGSPFHTLWIVAKTELKLWGVYCWMHCRLAEHTSNKSSTKKLFRFSRRWKNNFLIIWKVSSGFVVWWRRVVLRNIVEQCDTVENFENGKQGYWQ